MAPAKRKLPPTSDSIVMTTNMRIRERMSPPPMRPRDAPTTSTPMMTMSPRRMVKFSPPKMKRPPSPRNVAATAMTARVGSQKGMTPCGKETRPPKICPPRFR